MFDQKHLSSIANSSYLLLYLDRGISRFGYAMPEVKARKFWGSAAYGFLKRTGDNFLLYQASDKATTAAKFMDTNEPLTDAMRVEPCNLDIPLHHTWLFNPTCTPYVHSLDEIPYVSTQYSSFLTGPYSALRCEDYPVALHKRCDPTLQLGLRVGNSKTSIGYCLNDHPDAFAESILATWEIRLSAHIRETGSGTISLSTQELETVLSFSGGKEVDLVTKQLAQQVALKRISSDHVKKQLLPSIFYDLASDEYLDFVRSARVSNHRIVGYYGNPLDNYTGQNIYQAYTKELGVEESGEIAKRIPSDSAEKFRRAFLEFCSAKVLKRTKRLARCEDKTIDNRLSIVKTFIAAAADRLKTLSKEDQRPPRVASTELSKWMMTHGPRLAEEILRYQESVGGVFHIDHVIPLAAMSLDSIADIWSLAWHPSNLCIIPETDNLSKGAVFQEQRVRRNKLTERNFRKAEQALITQYHQWLEFTE